MIPCNRLWPWLGKEMRKTSTSFGVYQAWIDENFTAGSNTLEDFVNARADTIDWEVAMDVYKKINGRGIRIFQLSFLSLVRSFFWHETDLPVKRRHY